MELKEIYSILGIKPTNNYSEVVKAYRTRLKTVTSSLAQLKKAEEDTKEVEKELLSLNQAFNTISKDNIDEIYTKVTTAVVVVDEEDDELKVLKAYGIPNELSTLTKESGDYLDILKSTEIEWIDKDIEVIEETITLNDFMNPEGTLMINEGQKYLIPQGFLGVLAVSDKSHKIKFINVYSKNSLSFEYNATGDLLLKAYNDNTNCENGILTVKLRNYTVSVDLREFEYNSKHKIYVAKKRGAKIFNGDRGDYLIDLNKMKKEFKDHPITKELIKYLEDGHV